MFGTSTIIALSVSSTVDLLVLTLAERTGSEAGPGSVSTGDTMSPGGGTLRGPGCGPVRGPWAPPTACADHVRDLGRHRRLHRRPTHHHRNRRQGRPAPATAGRVQCVCLAEAAHWREGLARTLRQAPGFCITIIIGMAVGAGLNLVGIPPIEALYASAILNGLAAPHPSWCSCCSPRERTRSAGGAADGCPPSSSQRPCW